MADIQKIAPCLWFDRQAEEAAQFYTGLFPDSGIDEVTRYGEEGFEVHGMPAGTALTVAFRLAGRDFTALNGGPHFTFSEAISLVVRCETQAEVDHYWDGLLAGGGAEGRCGWLKDRYGLSWQVVPNALPRLLADPDPAKAGRVMQAMLQMTRLDLPTLQRAYEGA